MIYITSNEEKIPQKIGEAKVRGIKKN